MSRCICNRCTVAYNAGVEDERARIHEGVNKHYIVAPAAAIPVLRIVNDEKVVNQ